jgi:hypothetical protein
MSDLDNAIDSNLACADHKTDRFSAGEIDWPVLVPGVASRPRISPEADMAAGALINF